MKRFIIALAMAMLIIPAANAAPAYPYPIKVTQPDGSVLTIRVHGDEYLSWITCGNSLVTKGSDGYYHYASFTAEGVSQVLGARVRSTPSGDGSSVRPPQAAVQAALEKRQKASQYDRGPKVTPDTKSSSSYLVLLIQFSDLSFSTDSAAANAAFSNMMNQTGYADNGGTGSVKDYYSDNSHGMFAPIFDVVGPITVDDVMASYSENDGTTANGAPRLLVEACQKVDDRIDFSKYDLDGDGCIDNVFFYFAGYNAAEGMSGTIWPHASDVTYFYNVTLDGKQLGTYSCSSELKGTSGQNMAGIGTFCHEFGHTIGLPDFYDTDYEENGQGLALLTLSLMSSGNYNNDGKTPPYLTYEERHILGWDGGLTILEEGTNTLSPISENKAYCCPTGHDGEYYLFESRPISGWDRYTDTGGGLAVYHIDKSDFVLPDGSTAASKWDNGYEINIFAAHQCMDLVETVTPESSVGYYSELVFPGRNGVTELDTGTSPAFTAWNGMTTGYSLSEISFDGNSGCSSLRVDVSRQICGVVSSLSGTPVSGVEITVTPAGTQVTNLTADNAAGALQMSAPVTKAGSSPIKVLTDAQGGFLIPVSEEGDYVLSAWKEGYVPYSSTVTVDVTANLNITLPTIVEGGNVELKKYTNQPAGYCIGNPDYNGLDWYAGVRFSAEELAEYVGSDISSVSFMANNGGTGTVLEMGVKVFFDSEEVCSRAVEVPVFGAICTVDISDAGLTIPEGKSVLFAYYIYESTCYYPIFVTDINQHVPDAGLCKIYNRGCWDSSDWNDIPNANMVVSAKISDRGAIINLAGFNLISVNSEYTAGDPITLQLTQNPSNPPSTVEWYVDGESSSETQITLPAGIHTLKARLTYSSGRTEWVETSILVL